MNKGQIFKRTSRAKVVVSAKVEPRLVTALDGLAERNDQTRSEYLERVIKHHVRRQRA